MDCVCDLVCSFLLHRSRIYVGGLYRNWKALITISHKRCFCDTQSSKPGSSQTGKELAKSAVQSEKAVAEKGRAKSSREKGRPKPSGSKSTSKSASESGSESASASAP